MAALSVMTVQTQAEASNGETELEETVAAMKLSKEKKEPAKKGKGKRSSTGHKEKASKPYVCGKH